MSNVFQQFGAGVSAWDSPLDARLTFIRKTYLHVAGAVALFVATSFALYMSGVSQAMAMWLADGGRGKWMLILGGFMLLGWLGQSMARADRKQGLQYGGLVLYSTVEALIFAPLLYIAERFAPGLLGPAALITMLVFAGLSAVVLVTKKDFSFLRMALVVASFAALGLIIGAAIFGFSLGLWFSVAMIAVACGSILYTTSRVLHQYRTDQYVGASIELFAAVALLFWYVLRLLMQLRGRN